MDNLQKLRSGSHNNLSVNHPGIIGNRTGHQANGNGANRPHAQMYLNPNAMMSPSTRDDKVDDLTVNLRGMSLQNPALGHSPQTNSQMSNQTSASGGVSLNQHFPYYMNGQIVYGQGPYYTHQNGTQGISPSSNYYAANGAPLMGHAAYNGYGGSQFADNSPPSFNSSRIASAQMSSLITPRRSSGGSSNEPDAPGTPFTQYTGFGGGFPVFDNSPASLLSWSTPSPTETRFGLSKAQPPAQIPLRLQVLCQESPPIPKAVPAPFSPTKPLERRLENPNGITSKFFLIFYP